jgi:O-antigen ligase
VAVLLLLHLLGRPAGGERPRLQKHQVVIPLLMVVLSVGLVLTLSQRGTGLLRRAQTLTVLGNDVSFRWRQGMWDKSVRMIRDRPMLGWGVGAYPMQQALYFHPDVPTRAQIQIAVLGRGLLENAHNTYLQLAAELGLPGLALYLGVFGAFFGTGLRALPRLRKGFRRSVLIAALAAAAAHLVSAIGSPAWEFAECSLFLWAVLAIGMVAAGVGNRGRSPRSRENTGPETEDRDPAAGSVSS